MNNISRDEIDKIKRRRKRKSNKLLIGTKPSKALIAFNRHIEAAQSDIEKSRLKYSNDGIINENLDRKKNKLTLGIFDNAVCSNNIKNILQHSMSNNEITALYKNDLNKLPIVNHKIEKEFEKGLSINETLHDLADKCREQLNIRHCPVLDEWINSTPSMIRLRAAKADAYRNNRLEIIDCGIKMGSNAIDKTREPSRETVVEKKQFCEKQAQPSLSASTSISNIRISFPPQQAQGGASLSSAVKTRKINIDANKETAIHPLWDTPEELRTSHIGAFSDCSFFGETSFHATESRFGASLWMKQ